MNNKNDEQVGEWGLVKKYSRSSTSFMFKIYLNLVHNYNLHELVVGKLYIL
jgi:hypothetical protein